MDWQPIETAPRDGTIHVRGLWVTETFPRQPSRKVWREFIGYIDDESGRFLDPEYNEDFGWEADDFDAWLKLPAPPSWSAK